MSEEKDELYVYKTNESSVAIEFVDYAKSYHRALVVRIECPLLLEWEKANIGHKMAYLLNTKTISPKIFAVKKYVFSGERGFIHQILSGNFNC